MFSWMKVAAIVGISGALFLGTAAAQVLTTPADSTPPAPVLHHSNPNAKPVHTHTYTHTHTYAHTHTYTHKSHKLSTRGHKHHTLHTKTHTKHTLHTSTHKTHTTGAWKHHPNNV